MSMNYNDIEAPKFVDFGSNFDEDGEGDSWFSNDSVVINPDEDISFGDSFQVRARCDCVYAGSPTLYYLRKKSSYDWRKR